MPAYFVVDLDIHDADGFQEYRRRVDRLIEQYDGRYLVAAATVEVLEGQWQPKRLTAIELPSKARGIGQALMSRTLEQATRVGAQNRALITLGYNMASTGLLRDGREWPREGYTRRGSSMRSRMPP